MEDWRALRSFRGAVVYYGAASCGRAAGALAAVKAVGEACEEAGVRVKFVQTGCVGPCYLEPVLAVQLDGGPPTFYGGVTPRVAGEFARRVLVEGGLENWDVTLGALHEVRGEKGAEPPPSRPVPSLWEHPHLKHQVRRVLANCGLIDPESFDHYLARGGYSGLERALTLDPADVVGVVAKAGLRGRGGAGFPTAKKWEFCRKAPGDAKHVVCNADEGDPGAFMNRSLLEGDPHAVLEGLIVAGYAVGASEGHFYVRAEYPLAVRRLEVAIDQARNAGLLGDDVLGTGFAFDVEVVKGAGAFVCGEETALLESIMGRRGTPRPKPPYPATRGLWGRPTVINNVETLGNLPLILRHGPEWFRQVGTPQSPGTKTFSLVGRVKRRGLVEVPLGTRLGDLVNLIGGGVEGGGNFKAVQTGGPSGGMIPATLADTPVDYEALAKAGSIMGSGGLIVLDEGACVVELAHYFLSFTQAESCGQCVPCRIGTRRMLEILDDVRAGRASLVELELLRELAGTVRDASLCGLGQTAPNPVLTSLRYFKAEYLAHVEQKRCPSLSCPELVAFEVDRGRCTGCGACARSCPAKAVVGEGKERRSIDQAKCLRCGRCEERCPVGAVVRRHRFTDAEKAKEVA